MNDGALKLEDKLRLVHRLDPNNLSRAYSEHDMELLRKGAATAIFMAIDILEEMESAGTERRAVEALAALIPEAKYSTKRVEQTKQLGSLETQIAQLRGQVTRIAEFLAESGNFEVDVLLRRP